MPHDEPETTDKPQPTTRDTDPSVWPPLPSPPPPARAYQISSVGAALAAAAAGFLGNAEWMLWLAFASILLNLLSLRQEGSWVMDTDPSIWPPPPRPLPARRLLQLLSVLIMVAGAVAGLRRQGETALILNTTGFAANALSLWVEGWRRGPSRRSQTSR